MESKQETPEGGGWKIPLDPAPGLSAEGKELEWFPWIQGPGAAAVGLSPHFPWDDPPRSHPSRDSHRDAPGSPGAFPWQFLSGWMGFVCSWMGAGQELAQGRIQHLQRDPKGGQDPLELGISLQLPALLDLDGFPSIFPLSWHFRVSLVLGSAPPDLGKLRYPCTIPLFPDSGTKAWTDTLKSTFLRADPMEKEKFLLPSPFPGWFLQHPSITQTSSIRNGIGLPSRAAQGIQGGWKTPEKGQFLPAWP